MGLLDFLKGDNARDKADETTLFFATDFHGSELCFRKFVNAAAFYDAEVLVMGGDLSGKLMVPIVRKADGRYKATRHGETHLVEEDALEAFEREIRYQGFYPRHVDAATLERCEADPEAREEMFEQVIVETVLRWIDLAEEKLAGTNTYIVFAPGNDDPESVDKAIADRNSDRFRLVEGKVVEIAPGHELLSTGYTNITPWDTPREYPEDVIADRIEAIAQDLRTPETAIFNLHVPPYDSQLDTAPLITEDLAVKTSMGQAVSGPVGSTAVRAALEKWQPLLSLHGHIHESGGIARIGRTIAINPGSEYGEGVLRGALVTIGGGQLLRHQLTMG